MDLFIHSSKFIECAAPRVIPKVIYGLWVIMMGQNRFSSCNKSATLVGMLIRVKTVHVWGLRICGKFLYLLLNFAVKLKLLLKKGLNRRERLKIHSK